MLKKIAFTAYPVKDLQRARVFYEETLGLKASKISAGGKWIEYDLDEGGCFCITDMMQGVEPSEKSGGSVAFEVENIEQVVQNLKEKGVKIKMDIFDSPVCYICVALDSEGNSITIHQLKR